MAKGDYSEDQIKRHYRERAEVSLFWYDEDDELAKPVVNKIMANLMRELIDAGVRFPAIHMTGQK